MSYRLIHPALRSARPAPAAPALYPPSLLPPEQRLYPLSLGQETAPARPGIDLKKVLAVIALIAIAYAIWRALKPKKRSARLREPVTKNPVQRATTAQLAKALYEKLERKGDANPTVMRSLASYARR